MVAAGVRDELVLIIYWTWSRSATTGIIVAASLKVQEILGVLLLPMRGAHQGDNLHTSGKVGSWRMRAAKSRSKLVIPSRLGYPRYHLVI